VEKIVKEKNGKTKEFNINGKAAHVLDKKLILQLQ